MYDLVYTAGIVYTTLNIVAVIVCALATILVFILKMCNTCKLVYRLALYQVVAALFLAVMDILETTIFINYDEDPKLYDGLCKAIGLLGMYAQWMKLLFTMWVTFHLFCFAVLHKNLKTLEVLYVVTSLLVPAVIACVPLITNTYRYSIDVDTCYISTPNDTHHIAFIENTVLWNGPAMIILLVSSAAMVAMVIKLAYRVCWRLKYEQITEGDQFLKALNVLRSVTGLTPKFRGIPRTFRMLKFMANFRIILKQIKPTVRATSRLIWFLSLHDTYKYKWSKSSFLQMVFRLFNAILLYN